MIVAEALQKQFGRRKVLCGLNLRVPEGAVTLLLGANGAGKTTFLRIVAGLCRPDLGRVTIQGIDLQSKRREALAQLAFLPQAPRFHPRLSTLEVARYYARLRGRRETEVESALETWGLSDHLRASTAELSGGLRQRLAIAIFALARAPVLVLDEPGLSLDPEWRTRLQAYLASEARTGRTVLVATHLLGEWENKGDASVMLEGGRVGQWLAPSRLREQYPAAEGVATE